MFFKNIQFLNTNKLLSIVYKRHIINPYNFECYQEYVKVQKSQTFKGIT